MRLILFIAVAAGTAQTYADSAIRATLRRDMVASVDAEIERRSTNWLRYYRDLHTNPELSLHEVESARKLAARLADAGYTVATGVGGHGVVGVLKNGDGPTILIRGDMDALPVTEETELPYASRVTVNTDDGRSVGVMHACGHDVHQACLAGSAEILAALKANWRGTIIAIGQPAEEIGRGALAMIEDGLFNRFPKPDYCLALHVTGTAPAGFVAYTSGWALANVDSVDVTIHGRGGHGSRPHEAIDPVVTAAHVIVALQTIVSRRLDPIEPGVITIGSVTAGSKHNVIPDSAALQITVRSYGDETRRLLLEGIREVTTNTCRALGCVRDPDIRIREDEFTPATYNDPELTASAAGVLRELLGAERVFEIPGQMGGEDFGRYAKHLGVPGLIFWLGSVNPERFEQSRKPGAPPLPSIHSARFAPDAEPTIRNGVRCMTALALALLDSDQ